MLFELGFEHIALLKTYSTPYRFATLEKNKRRHRLHTVALRKLDIFIYINLKHIGRVTYFILDFFKNRPLHTARAAPCCKKINQSRFITLNQFIKIVHNIFFRVYY